MPRIPGAPHHKRPAITTYECTASLAARCDRFPAADWGEVLSGQGRLVMTTAPWLFYAPTLALALVVFSVNMLSDALRDALDPRLRGQLLTSA